MKDDIRSHLSDHLPYWTTLSISLRGGKTLPVIMLKDGTMAVGLKIHGHDVYAADNDVLDHNIGRLGEALNSLPKGAYLQAVFESGFSFAPLIEAFKKQSQGRFELIKVGRELQAERFAACDAFTRCTITYWLGLEEILACLEGAKIGFLKRLQQRVNLSGTVKMTNAERVSKAAQLLQDALEKFALHLTGFNLRYELLDEAQIIAACHRAINPTSKLRMHDR